MAVHVVIAALNDAQFAQLEASSIPHRTVPQQFVNELLTRFPQVNLAEIAEKAFKRVLGEARIDAERIRHAQELEAYRGATLDELGLR